MPPSRDIRTFNKMDILKGLDWLLNDQRPRATGKTKMMDILNDEVQPQLGMMTFGPGRNIPFRNLKQDYLSDANRIENLMDLISTSWGKHLNSQISKPEVARVNEVGELIRDISRKSEPMSRHIQNIEAATKTRQFMESLKHYMRK